MASHISSHNKNIIQESKKSQHPNPRMCGCQVAENCPPLMETVRNLLLFIKQMQLQKYITNVLILDLPKALLKGDCLIIALLLIMNNTKINQNYLLLSGKRKTRDKSSKSSGWWWEGALHKRLEAKNVICLLENFHIMTGDKDKLLNERNDLITKCRHVDKFLLKNYKSRRRGRGRGRDRGRLRFSS